MQNLEQIVEGLNQKQKEAVSVLSGPLLILAGAGSGKTRVLTHRIAYLMANGVEGRDILAVTFTNKAAKEMKERIEKLLFSTGGTPSSMPSVGTFHSICVRILRANIEKLPQEGAGRYTSNYVIFDTDDVQKLLKLIIKDLKFDDKELKVKGIQSIISSLKNRLVFPSGVRDELAEWGNSKLTEAVEHIYPEYQKRMKDHNALDFDDLLMKTVEVFEKCPEVLDRHRKKWKHVMVDEYQDTNFVQYRMIRLLVDEHQNIGVVGDDHQSIYSFRGADFRNILDFEKDFPAATVVKLEQNYRSTGNILKAANHLIDHNETGRKKDLWTEQSAGEKILIKEVWDEKMEGNYIADEIKQLTHNPDLEITSAEGARSLGYGDVAILYRMNAQSRAIEEALMRNRIPYQIIGGTRFFDRKEIKDVLAYLRLIFNHRDDVAFLRIINVPTRKLGAATIDIVKDYAREYQISLYDVLESIEDVAELNNTKKQVLKQFYLQIKQIKEERLNGPVTILISKVIESFKILEYLDDGTGDGETRQQNVKELLSVATRYDGAEDSLAAFLEGVALVSDIDNHDKGNDTVTLMTVHASKGLEFPLVFLPGWEDGMFPSSSSQFDANQLEEERRLGYVAVTRAEKKCVITHAKQRMLFGQTNYSSGSKFIKELGDEATTQEIYASTPNQRSGPQFYAKGREGYKGKVTFSHPLMGGQTKTGNPSPGPQTVSEELKALNNVPKTREEALFGSKASQGNSTDFAVGQRIKHMEFGQGTIIQIRGDNLSVAFPGEGIKVLVASSSPIEVVD